MNEKHEPEINALLEESRVFPPPPEWRKNALVTDPGVYDRAAKDPEAFWESFAKELEWMQPWSTVLEWKPPHAKWFVGGKLNVERQLPRPPHPHGAPQQGGDRLGR